MLTAYVCFDLLLLDGIGAAERALAPRQQRAIAHLLKIPATFCRSPFMPFGTFGQTDLRSP